MPTILSQKQLTRYRIDDIDIARMSPQNIIEEAINRILFICDKHRVNITNKELSIILGKSDGYISHIFSDYYPYNPSFEIFLQLSCLLHVPPHYLFHPNGEKFKQKFDDTETIKTLKQFLINKIKNKIETPPYVEDEEKLIYRISRLEKIKERIEEELKNMK